MSIDSREIAKRLDEAVRNAAPIEQLSAAQPLTVEQAYEVQHTGIALRGERGDPVVGVKLGFTSKAKAAQMGVKDVIAGELTASMRIEDGGVVATSTMVHPRIEPEVVFRLGAEIDPEDPRADPLAAVSEVAAGLEIIDSRYRDFKFSLEDVVADNTSAAGFVLGPWRRFDDVGAGVDLSNAAVVLEVNGAVVETGSTAAILGNPLRALEAVKRMARQYGFALPAGSVILAGAATAAVPLVAGAVVQAEVVGLGRVSVTAEGHSDG